MCVENALPASSKASSVIVFIPSVNGMRLMKNPSGWTSVFAPLILSSTVAGSQLNSNEAFPMLSSTKPLTIVNSPFVMLPVEFEMLSILGGSTSLIILIVLVTILPGTRLPTTFLWYQSTAVIEMSLMPGTSKSSVLNEPSISADRLTPLMMILAYCSVLPEIITVDSVVLKPSTGLRNASGSAGGVVSMTK